MKYYQQHEHAYTKLFDQGYFGWGYKKSIKDLLAFSQRFELGCILERIEGYGKKILDLGCGTGPTTFYLAAKSADVTGIDISKTAIEKARVLGAEMDSQAKFICGDFLEASFHPGSFSTIVDSSFLHCIVFDQDRIACLSRIYELLEPGGSFILHTMISDRPFDFGPRFHFDEQGILWYLSANSEVVESKPYKNGYATPQRRVLSSDAIRKELLGIGLVEMESKILTNDVSDGADVLFGSYQKS